MQDFEKLGVFYLGKSYDLATKKRREDLLLYDSRDLVTHAVCVGMTGSGKTGLCLSLIEEAAIDGVPAILIDPKGDLCDLLLTFPDLAPADVRPWINEDDAARKKVSPDEFAKQQAELWAKGLAEWGQDGARIARLRSACEATIYTPGSTAGRNLALLRSLAAPTEAARADAEAVRRVGPFSRRRSVIRRTRPRFTSPTHSLIAMAARRPAPAPSAVQSTTSPPLSSSSWRTRSPLTEEFSMRLS